MGCVCAHDPLSQPTGAVVNATYNSSPTYALTPIMLERTMEAHGSELERELEQK